MGVFLMAISYSLWGLAVTSAIAITAWGPSVALGVVLGAIACNQLAQALAAG